jgi:lysophospholipase L1-like esterase
MVSTGVVFGIVEIIASYWLKNHSSQDQFRQYGTLKQNLERYEERGESVSKYMSHRFIGYIPSPNYKRNDNYHNSDGYRGDPIPPVKEENEFRIVCVGGSTTYTNFVHTPAEAYPAVLEEILHDRGYTHVRVINSGVEGYSSWETLANVNYRVLDLDPDMVIVYHAVNDVISRVVWPPTAHRGDGSGFTQHVSGLDKPESVLERSTLARMLMVKTGRWSSPLELQNVFYNVQPTHHFWKFVVQQQAGSYPKDIFATVPIEQMLEENTAHYFERNIGSVIAICKQNGITPVLATFKVNRESKDSLAYPVMADAIEEHNEVSRTLGAELDVPVFEFAEAFPSDNELFVGSVHLTTEGARLKATLFADFLMTQELVPAP